MKFGLYFTPPEEFAQEIRLDNQTDKELYHEFHKAVLSNGTRFDKPIECFGIRHIRRTDTGEFFENLGLYMRQPGDDIMLFQLEKVLWTLHSDIYDPYSAGLKVTFNRNGLERLAWEVDGFVIVLLGNGRRPRVSDPQELGITLPTDAPPDERRVESTAPLTLGGVQYEQLYTRLSRTFR